VDNYDDALGKEIPKYSGAACKNSRNAREALSKGQKVPKAIFDDIDLKILMELQRDGRLSLADLSEKVNLSPSPCLRRIRRLESTGIITRYVAVLDQAKVGLPVSVFVSIKLESQRVEALERFKRAIAKWPEVLECYLMTGPRDYLLRIVVADLGAYERFLKQKLTRIDGIASIDSSFALEQTKYSNVLPIV
jgi:Lrp/AsnC family transcriptional regulator, leucine-responsive regulatory protein